MTRPIVLAVPKGRILEEAAGSAAQSDAAAPSADDVPDAMLARVGGDRSLLTEMIRLFAEDAPRTLDRIRASIDARDADALRRAAHALKGAAANFEATDVVRAARALEEIGQSGRIDDAASPWRTLTTEMDRLMARLTSLAT